MGKRNVEVNVTYKYCIQVLIELQVLLDLFKHDLHSILLEPPSRSAFVLYLWARLHVVEVRVLAENKNRMMS